MQPQKQTCLQTKTHFDTTVSDSYQLSFPHSPTFAKKVKVFDPLRLQFLIVLFVLCKLCKLWSNSVTKSAAFQGLDLATCNSRPAIWTKSQQTFSLRSFPPHLARFWVNLVEHPWKLKQPSWLLMCKPGSSTKILCWFTSCTRYRHYIPSCNGDKLW